MARATTIGRRLTLNYDPSRAGSAVVVRINPQRREMFRTQTNVRYWAYVSPGVVMIRKMSLRLVKRDAERRYRAVGSTTVNNVPPSAGKSI